MADSLVYITTIVETRKMHKLIYILSFHHHNRFRTQDRSTLPTTQFCICVIIYSASAHIKTDKMSISKENLSYMNLIKEHVSRSLCDCDSVSSSMTAHGPMNQKIQDFLWLSVVFSMVKNQLSQAYITAHGLMNLRDGPIKL